VNSCSKHCRAGGFLLLELLVALALSAIVTLLLLNGVRISSIGLDRLSHRADQLEQRRSLEELLRRAFASVAPLPVTVDGPPFDGQKSRVSFLSLFEDSGPGLYRVDLAVEMRRGKRQLVLTRRPVAAAGTPPERSILARHVGFFRLAYFGSIAPSEGPAWHDKWRAASVPPHLVRITVDLGDGLARPPIVIRVWGVAG
jgi:type II secretory pathway pseudopilin PulG